MSPTKSLFNVGSRRISIFIVSTFVSLGCSGNTTRIMRRTLKIFTCCSVVVEKQLNMASVLTRLLDDLKALDSIVHFLVLVVGGWSGLPPFQYRLTRTKSYDTLVVYSIEGCDCADESYSFVETDLYLLQKFDDNCRGDLEDTISSSTLCTSRSWRSTLCELQLSSYNILRHLNLLIVSGSVVSVGCESR
ncbi:hypothetical protein Tco_0856470 [Tanacetum coccineum]|uniref:Uncharacterized protein n=1 Tax=Tanacetum coccineum TaxID=301880 RepID=A0ABQ5B4I9_9ASTR